MSSLCHSCSCMNRDEWQRSSKWLSAAFQRLFSISWPRPLWKPYTAVKNAYIYLTMQRSITGTQVSVGLCCAIFCCFIILFGLLLSEPCQGGFIWSRRANYSTWLMPGRQIIGVFSVRRAHLLCSSVCCYLWLAKHQQEDKRILFKYGRISVTTTTI